MRKYKLVVKKGIELIDDYYLQCENSNKKDWKKSIDLNQLDMRKGGVCILGQLFGYYYSGVDILDLDNDQCHKYGFDVLDLNEFDEQKYNRQYQDLTKEWKRQL